MGSGTVPYRKPAASREPLSWAQMLAMPCGGHSAAAIRAMRLAAVEMGTSSG